VPLRVRQPAWLASVALLIVVALVAGIFGLRGRTHHGTGTAGPASQGAVTQISLRGKAAHDYDPIGGDGEHPEATAFAIDNDPSTYWQTETYTTGDLQKAGVGIAIDAAPGAVVRELRIGTPTAGFAADVYVSDADALPASIDDPGWQRVATVSDVAARQTVTLDTAGQRSRFVLLWITKLPSGGDRVKISELALYR
jgi:serine/threonine-protein kinase